MSLSVDPAAAMSSAAVSATRSMLVPDASTLLNDASLTLLTIMGPQVSSLRIVSLLSHYLPDSVSSFENPPFHFDPSLSNTQLVLLTIASLISQPVHSLAPVVGPVQSVISFSSAANYIDQNSSFGANASIIVNPVSFSDAMASINTDLTGSGWNFSGIGVAGFGQMTQFGPNTSNGPSLPPLPPTLQNLSVDRPRLPAVPLSSPLVHDPEDTLPVTSKIANTIKGQIQMQHSTYWTNDSSHGPETFQAHRRQHRDPSK